METKKDVFLIYDFMFLHIKPEFKIKKDMLYKKIQDNCDLYILSLQNFQNGTSVGEFRNLLYQLKIQKDKINVHSLVWNGSEMGCRLFVDNLKEFGLDDGLCYLEQGLLPQSNSLRFLNTPVRYEVTCGLPINPDEYYENNYDKDEVESYIENCLVNCKQTKNTDKIKNKVSIVCQISSDSSLFSLLNPRQDFPRLIEEKLLDIYGYRMQELELVLCPHPVLREEYKNFNFDAKYKISDKSTIDSCLESELVIAYNSTMLYEAAAKGCNVVALSENHPLNKNNDIFSLYCKIKDAQFDPLEITYKDLIKKKNLFDSL